MEYGWREAPELDPDEQVLLRKAANRAQGRRSVGGRLTVTDRRLMFKPTIVDSMLFGKAWSANRDEVTEIGATERGGLRKRLSVRTSDGAEQLFVVNKLDDVVRELVEDGLPAGAVTG